MENNIKYLLNVRLIEHPGLSKKSTESILYPFKDVEIFANEIQICPFCGRPIRKFNCNCKDFQANLVKMQNFYGDEKHKSKLHSSDINLTVALSKPVSDLQFRALGKQEILNLESDLWDFANTQVDSLSSRCFKVSPVRHEDNENFFVCKDLISKDVYRFKVPKIKYKAREICLAIYKQNTVSNPESGKRRLGNYHFEYYWENLVSFENWNELCANIKSFQYFN